nr:hypothetical protein Itr_chr07CG16570 [Ipomoea trifida]
MDFLMWDSLVGLSDSILELDSISCESLLGSQSDSEDRAVLIRHGSEDQVSRLSGAHEKVEMADYGEGAW